MAGTNQRSKQKMLEAEITENIINYLLCKYDPSALLVYGSYADGSDNANSDFDALVISENAISEHDASVVDGVTLDVFICCPDIFDRDIDCGRFVQIYDSVIVYDKSGLGARLKSAVTEYIDKLPMQSTEEKLQQIEWCEKMLLRSKRDDAEGYYRWHWILTDSLEIYCGIIDLYYSGPKKALRWLQSHDPDASELYCRALSSFEYGALEKWIGAFHLKFEETAHV